MVMHFSFHGWLEIPLAGQSMRLLFQQLSAVTDQAFSTLLTMNFP